MKLLPALFCAGLSYVTFYEKCSHMGIPVNAAEALDGTVASVKGHRDHDLVVFDDSLTSCNGIGGFGSRE